MRRTRRWATGGSEATIATLQSVTANLDSRSRCPWTYSYNTDPNRVPRTLIEAHCTTTHPPHVAGQCEQVYYYVPVKRNEHGTWTERWIELSVGCTLAEPHSAPPITYD